MSLLPNTPKPWLDLLALMHDEVRFQLQGLMRPLEKLMGPITLIQQPGGTEPEGYVGITRQANYQRLLLSEWALAQKHPEEFLRRAAMNEQMFLQLKRQDNQQARTIVMLMDVGPEQLGKPRLIHLAIWVLLIKRALGSNAEFFYGFVQDEKQTLYKSIDRKNMLEVLASRQCSGVNRLNLQAWQKIVETKCEEEGFAVSECWLVGGKTCAEYEVEFPNLKRLAVTEKLLSEEPKLILRLLSNINREKVIELVLPDDNACVHMLRNPFKSASKSLITDASKKYDIVGMGATSRNGRKIAFRTKDRGIALYSIPGSANGSLGKVRYFMPVEGETFAAVNVTKRRLAMLTFDNDNWYLYLNSTSDLGKISFSRSQRYPLSSNLNSISEFILTRNDDENNLWIVDEKKILRKINCDEKTSVFKTVATQVMAVEYFENALFYVARTNSGFEVVTYSDKEHQEKAVYHSNLNESDKLASQVFVHSSGPWRYKSVGSLAFPVEKNKWALVSHSNIHSTVTVLEEETVIGTININQLVVDGVESLDVNLRKKNCLLVLSGDQKTLHARVESLDFVLYEQDYVITEIKLNTNKPYLHYRDSTGAYCVYSFPRRELLMRLEG